MVIQPDSGEEAVLFRIGPFYFLRHNFSTWLNQQEVIPELVSVVFGSSQQRRGSVWSCGDKWVSLPNVWSVSISVVSFFLCYQEHSSIGENKIEGWQKLQDWRKKCDKSCAHLGYFVILLYIMLHSKFTLQSFHEQLPKLSEGFNHYKLVEIHIVYFKYKWQCATGTSISINISVGPHGLFTDKHIILSLP